MMRQALRSLGKSPAYSLTAILTLGLGIGLTTAAFSLLNGFVLRPLPFTDQDSLVDISETSTTALCAGCAVGTSFPIYQEWRQAARSFSRIEAVVERPFSLSGGAQPAARVGGALVSGGLFDLLGVAPIVGRTFNVDDDRAGAAPVAILSQQLWQERFGGGSVAGRTVRLNGAEYIVVGVMPAGFGFPEFARVWIPLTPQAQDWAIDDRSLGVIARLSADVSMGHAQDEMIALGRDLAERYPASHREWTIQVRPLRDSFVGEEAQLFALLVGMVLFVLLIACVNLAGVGLARAAAREREFAVRVAIGARSRDLVQLLLLESFSLALAGGSLGLLLAPWGVQVTRATLPAEIPAWLRFDVDWRVAAFCGLVTITAGFAAGLLPAWRSAKPQVLPALKSGAGTGSQGHRLRFWLVGGELALTLILIVSAGLLTKSFARAVSFDPGYPVEGLLTAEVGLLGGAYDNSQTIALFAANLEEQLQRAIGIRSGAISHTAFIAGFGGADQRIEAEDVAVGPGASPRFAEAVSADYFTTVGIGLRAGRVFTRTDTRGSEPVAVVNEALASRIWPGQSPLGKRLRLPNAEWRTVVGMVANVGGSPLAVRPEAPPYVYLPLAQAPGRPLRVHARSATTAYAVAGGVTEAVRSVDRDEPVENVRSAEDSFAQWILPARVAALLVGGVAALALGLAAVGLYGVVAYTVGRRTREFGIRVAIGASTAHALRLVLGQAVGVTVAGALIGLIGAAASTGLLRSVLFGTNPLDPTVFAISAGMLVLVMLVATIGPARRAARVEPQEALREE